MELRFSLRPQRLIHRLENVLSPSAGFQIIQDRSNGGLSRRQPMDGWAMDIYEKLSNFNEIVATANLTPSVAL